jgi:hypothetical protein
VNLPDGKLETLYQAIFGERRGIQALHIGLDHDLLVDEEGLLKPGRPGIFPHLQQRPDAGRGLILRHDYKGNLVSCTAPIEPVRAAVSWVHAEGVDANAHDHHDDENWNPVSEPETLGADDGTGRRTFQPRGAHECKEAWHEEELPAWRTCCWTQPALSAAG